MAKERLTAGETMGLMEELDRYPTGSIYPVTRKGKNGESIPNGYVISFYYDSLDGKKQKKTCTAKSEEALIPLRTKFLIELFYEKLAVSFNKLFGKTSFNNSIFSSFFLNASFS